MNYSQEDLSPMLDYIKTAWRGGLFRSNRGLADAAADPKVLPGPDGRWNVYIPEGEQVDAIMETLRLQMSELDLARINLVHLPEFGDITQHGLLYLPKPYVVPGGRFNEMYGWDSYFIIAGLLLDDEVELAKGMVDNCIYQVNYYGKILNANRTYYLTRSNPPFLSRMILEVFQKTQDTEWLSSSLSALNRTYEFWTSEPHLTPETGLSRYYDTGEGPAPEVVMSERDEFGHTHYQRILEHFLSYDQAIYNIDLYYDRENHRLTDLFYKGDRTMRESGFDPSDRFGPFNVGCASYNPICLNSLLYQFERDMVEIITVLGLDGEEVWDSRSRQRRAKIHELLWSEEDGYFYDYHTVRKEVRIYPYVTALYALWTGLATQEQAKRLVENLPDFEREGGLSMSTRESGMQWDEPFGWAPTNMIAIEGLRAYGFAEDAERLSKKFISMCLKNFRRDGYLLEKYNVVNATPDTDGIDYGYSTNEIGFGWTNGVILRLLRPR